MSTESYRQDDDDLFDYDPSLEKPISSTYDSKINSNPTSDNQVLDDIYRQMDNLVHESGVEHINEFRIRLTDSFYEAYHEFKSKSSVVAHIQSVHMILDEMTNGRFSKIYFLKHLEQNIFRRLSIHYLVSAITDQNDQEGLTFKEFLAKADIQVTDDFVNIYFGTALKISSHTLNIERAMYMAACQELNVTPNSLVIHEDLTPTDIAKAFHATASSFKKTVFDSIYSEMSNSQSLPQALSNIFSSETIFQVKNI